MTDVPPNETDSSTDYRRSKTADRSNDVGKRAVLHAASNGPMLSVERPGKRRLLKGVLASAAAALGLPLLGSTGASTSEPEETLAVYSRAEVVEDVLAQNDELLATLDELRLLENVRGAGLQVSAIGVDGKYLPQLVLYLATDAGMLSHVVSPDEVPLAPRTFVVTTEETMAEAPIEWPEEKRTEFPETGVLFQVGEEGWVHPEEVSPEGSDPLDAIYEMCDDPTETGCGPVENDTCWYRGCCGVIHGKQCYIDDDSSSIFQPICDKREETTENATCWWNDGPNRCECAPLLR